MGYIAVCADCTIDDGQQKIVCRTSPVDTGIMSGLRVSPASDPLRLVHHHWHGMVAV
jgi:hypothetical protein